MRQEGPRSRQLQEPLKKLDRTRLDEWHPELTGDPLAPRPRVYSPLEREHLRKQTTRWLLEGVVERTPRPVPWTNNLVFVAKANGSIRVCVDCTPANRVTEDFDWPLPRLQDLRHRTKGALWFSRMDLRDAFFRISVPEEWRHLTSFTCDGVDYQFSRMPFGLKTAPSVFQKFMDTKLARHREHAFWYMDDVLVYARSLAELRRRTLAVRLTLARAGATINEEKSEYDKQGLLFAGMWIFGGGQGPNHKKVDQVLALPAPRTKVEKQSALGLVSYLRDHVPLLSLFTADLSTSDTNTISPSEYEEHWERLRRHLSKSITTLGEWKEEEDADLYTDASNRGCAAVLIQRGRIIALASRKLTPAETRYSATDREQLGLLLAAKKMRPFLHRSKGMTRVHTDHAALVTRQTTDMTPRQARWHTIIQEWIPTLVHVRGKDNPADYFSRWGLEILGGQISCI